MAVRMNLNKDLYGELGVALNGRSPADIPKSEIEEAVKGLEALHGKERPNLSPEQQAGRIRRIEAIKEASAVLLDDKERAKYDRFKGFNASAHSAATNEHGKNADSPQVDSKKPEASRPAPRGYFKVIGVSEDASPKEIESAINKIKENAKSTGGELTNAQKKAIEVVGDQNAREKYIDNLKRTSTALSTNYKGSAAELIKDNLVIDKNISDKVNVPPIANEKKIEIPKVRGKMGFFIAGAKFIGSLIVTDIAMNKASEYLFGDANASNKPSVPIANPITEHKVEPVPEQPEHKALREKKQLEVDKIKLEAEKAELEAQNKAKGSFPAPDGTGGAKPQDIVKDTVKGEDNVRVVQQGDTLSKIADSRDADMKKARAQVREALGGNADNKTVLSVLAIALAENNGKENINRIEAGEKLSISGDKIKQVVAELKEAGKLENGRLALGNETTLTEIFARAPNTPGNNQQLASAAK